MKINYALILDAVVMLTFLGLAVWLQNVYVNDSIARLVSYLKILFNLFTIFYDVNFKKEKRTNSRGVSPFLMSTNFISNLNIKIIFR
ncbi:hypothetical protein AP20H10_06890 [Apilactobacillus apinorum]|uniref:Uncharacterized protein n=1 Tax=Apilactobacillus apinorum TaxID=1218495 RepID=A0ABP9ZHQ6_9LACO